MHWIRYLVRTGPPPQRSSLLPTPAVLARQVDARYSLLACADAVLAATWSCLLSADAAPFCCPCAPLAASPPLSPLSPLPSPLPPPPLPLGSPRSPLAPLAPLARPSLPSLPSLPSPRLQAALSKTLDNSTDGMLPSSRRRRPRRIVPSFLRPCGRLLSAGHKTASSGSPSLAGPGKAKDTTLAATPSSTDAERQAPKAPDAPALAGVPCTAVTSSKGGVPGRTFD
ncbi:hypothetical protein DCS_03197 [Drechmeria coniospora]|uniref:Uncharacterized protein n=1 Tax=Drechmeria coniospora TaxID=98403 RepID=A0A151GYD3_DRECN|nr:hypothetical protein DCS_03197 [Drechmeria coniospora]KYK62052.1 hypothetical protein DCS_03197 [Drechmeria coniospora]